MEHPSLCVHFSFGVNIEKEASLVKREEVT
jgi:hypothetical protein